MKRFSLTCVLALALCTLCAVATASITPASPVITGTGPFTWTYDLQLAVDQNVNSGTAPAASPVPHTNLSIADFFTIYDFAGYITGTCAGPAGWTCTVQNVGYTPDDVVPTDDATIINITWAYTGGSTLLGQPSGIDLGNFSAQSIYGQSTSVYYTARAIANSGPQIGAVADNVGNTTGPVIAFSVTYDGNTNTGGTVPIDGNAYAESHTVTVLGNTGSLVKTGYTFAGWNTAADGSGTSYAGTGSATFAMGLGNVTLYAQWTLAVLPLGVAIPTLSEWGLAFLVLLLVGFGMQRLGHSR